MAVRTLYVAATDTYRTSTVPLNEWQRNAVDAYDADTGEFLLTVYEDTFHTVVDDVLLISNPVSILHLNLNATGNLVFLGPQAISTDLLRIYELETDGTVVESWTYDPTDVFSFPPQLRVDAAGDIYLAYLSTATGPGTLRVRQFSPTGTPIAFWDFPTSPTLRVYVVLTDVQYFVDGTTSAVHQNSLTTGLPLADLVAASAIDDFERIRFDGTDFLIDSIEPFANLVKYSTLGVPGTIYPTVSFPAGVESAQVLGGRYWHGATQTTHYFLAACLNSLDPDWIWTPDDAIPDQIPVGATSVFSAYFEWLVLGSDAAVCVAPSPPIPETTTFATRRLRRSPHVSAELFNQFISSLQIDIEAGVGLSTGQGSDPQLMLRLSHDGGFTWGLERGTSIGALGEYDTRAIWHRLGRARDLVVEVSCSDPVFVALFDAFIEGQRGTS